MFEPGRWRIAGVIGIWLLAACGQNGTASIHLKLGNGRDAVTRTGEATALAEGSLAVDACGPGLSFRMLEEGVATSEVRSLEVVSPVFNWLKYFEWQEESDLLTSETQSVTVPAGSSWEVSVFGAVALKANSYNEYTTTTLGQLVNVVGPGTLFGESQYGSSTPDVTAPEEFSDHWDCGSPGDWNRTNLVSPFVESSPISLGAVPQILVPLTGRLEGALELTAGETREVPLTVTAARVPFGAYSRLSGKSFGRAGMLNGSDLDQGALAPFAAIKLANLATRISIYSGSSGHVQVIPIVQDIDTGMVWRGMADGPVNGYNSGSSEEPEVYFYPLPPNRDYRVGLFLVCDYPSHDCGSVTLGPTSTGSTVTGTWSNGAVLCLTTDVKVDALDASLENAVPEVDLSDVTGVSMGSNQLPVEDALRAVAPDGCVGRFFE